VRREEGCEGTRARMARETRTQQVLQDMTGCRHATHTPPAAWLAAAASAWAAASAAACPLLLPSVSDVVAPLQRDTHTHLCQVG
jgi:hypothetical protein